MKPSLFFSLLLSLLLVEAALWSLISLAAPQAGPLCVQAGNAACFSTISAALQAAHPGDTIRVAAGTYLEYVTVTETVTLEGGWNAAFSARDPQVNVSLIRPPDATFSVVNIQGQIGDAAAVAPTLDGFLITGGGGGNHGGGLRITDSNALVSHDTISGNIGYLLGGGVWVQRGAPLLLENHIENNQLLPGGSAVGGGVDLEDTQATLASNRIISNSVEANSGSGGGVAIQGGGPVTLTSNLIVGNRAATRTSATPTFDGGYGGGIYIENAPVDLAGNTVTGNAANTALAVSYGGGYGGGVYIVNSPAFTLTNNTITTNTAGYKYLTSLSGGGLEVDSSHGSLSDNLIAGNYANGQSLFGNGNGDGNGGGLSVLTSTLSLQGDQILNNLTTIHGQGYGGGLYARASSISLDAVRFENNYGGNAPVYGLGGAMAFFNSPFTMTNGLVVANIGRADDTAVGGLYAGPGSPGLLINNTFANNRGQGIRTGSPLILTNNIVMGQTTGISLTAGVPVSATFNDFYNNATNQRGFPMNVTNIVINPQLDPTYHLRTPSPLIDAGVAAILAPDHDMDGEPRPMQGASGLFRFDIGADEFSGPAQITRRLATQPADFTLIGPGNPQDNPASDGSNDWIGNAVLGGDINGDQRADLIVGAQNLSGDFDGGVNDDGRVFALYNNGVRRLGKIDLFDTAANLEVRSWLNQQHIGKSFASGDINGDGADDLIIGASGAAAFSVTGAVYIFAGGTGLSGTRTLSPTMQATYQIRADQNTSSFAGANALAAGQLDGAGPEDLAVAEGNATANGRKQAGAVYLFFGSKSFPALWAMQTLSPSLVIFGPEDNAELGKVVLADVNGDHRLDLIMRSLKNIYVFFGPFAPGVIDLASRPADLTQGGLQDGPLAAGDVDGDGKAEVVAGDGQQVKVFAGGTLNPLATFTGANLVSLDAFDWNHDGKADIVMGDNIHNRVFVVLGRTSLAGTAPVSERADWIINGELPTDQFGFSLGSGDLDGDGGADLILGSRTHVLDNRADPHFNDAGAVYVMYGSAAAGTPMYTMTPTKTPTITPTSTSTNTPTGTLNATPTPTLMLTPTPPHRVFLPAVRNKP